MGKSLDKRASYGKRGERKATNFNNIGVLRVAVGNGEMGTANPVRNKGNSKQQLSTLRHIYVYYKRDRQGVSMHHGRICINKQLYVCIYLCEIRKGKELEIAEE